jgi:dihydrofolate reductase
MANFIFIATSLDGYIARENGDIDWLMSWENPAREDYGYSIFIKGVDAIVMGSGTFKTVQHFKSWPYHMPVFVMSHHAEQLDEVFLDKVQIVQDEPAALVDQLHQQSYENLYIDGGKVIQSFLRQNLIDEMILTRIPILLGSGIPLFGETDKDIYWKHIKTDVFQNGLIQTHYRKRPG